MGILEGENNNLCNVKVHQIDDQRENGRVHHALPKYMSKCPITISLPYEFKILNVVIIQRDIEMPHCANTLEYVVFKSTQFKYQLQHL